jgi:hypothetical protein
MRFVHAINPVNMPEGHELSWTQDLVFESMRLAKEQASEDTIVRQLGIVFPEDESRVSDHFEAVPKLNRSVQDCGNFQDKRKLPLIGDILQIAYERSEPGDYLIYSNVDIMLTPVFYNAVKALIAREGFDALVINKRRVDIRYQKVAELPLIFAQLGKSHPGFDCFVFKRALYPKMRFEQICLGVPGIGISLAHNLFALADNPRYFDNLHLTVHAGMWVMPKRPKDTFMHNRKEYAKVTKYLRPKYKLERFPYAGLNPFMRWLKWALNPSLSVKLEMELQAESWGRKLKYYLDEIRWRILHR